MLWTRVSTVTAFDEAIGLCVAVPGQCVVNRYLFLDPFGTHFRVILKAVSRAC